MFTYDSLASILEEITERGYSLLRVDEGPLPDGGKSFYVRHDVDLSALALSFDQSTLVLIAPDDL